MIIINSRADKFVRYDGQLFPLYGADEFSKLLVQAKTNAFDFFHNEAHLLENRDALLTSIEISPFIVLGQGIGSYQ